MVPPDITIDEEHILEEKPKRSSLALRITVRQILAIAVPIMIVNLFHSIIQVTDMVFMAQVGKHELAACGQAGLFYVVISMIGLSLAQGAQVLIARRAGEDNRHAIGRITDNLLYITLAMSIAFFLIIKFAGAALLDLLLVDENVVILGRQYLNYRAYGIPFVFLVFALGSFYSGIGRTSVFIWSATVMMAVNIILNYLLVFGKYGFPEMGIEGSALSSSISEAVACAIMFLHALIRGFPGKFNFFRFDAPSRPTLRKIMKVSLPIVVQTFTGSFGWFIFFAMIGNYLGTDPLAASQVLRMLYIFFSVPSRGLGGAVNTLVSNVMGQRKLRLVRTATLKVIWVSIITTALVTIPLILWPKVFIAMMDPKAELLSELTMATILTLCISLMAMSVSTTLFRAVTGTGAVRVVLWIEVISIAIYLAYAFLVMEIFNSKNLAVVWTVEIVYWLVLLGFCWRYLEVGKWFKLRI